jgi:hypothetical protein
VEKIMISLLNTAHEPHLKRVVKGLALAVVLMTGLAASAQADDMRDRGRPGNSQWAMQNRGQQKKRIDKNWNDHEWQARRYWSRPYYYQRPHYTYAPPLVYAPPPQYEEPSISFFIPLHIY